MSVSSSSEAPVTSPVLHWLTRLLRAGLAVAIVSCWAQVLLIGLAFGPHPRIVPWTLGLVAATAAWTVWAALLARRRRFPAVSPRLLGRAAALWMLLSLAAWYVFTSPFSRDVTIALAFAASSGWLFWTACQFFTTWRWPARLATLFALLLVAVAFPLTVRSSGLDGDALPRLVWRPSYRPTAFEASSEGLTAATPDTNASDEPEDGSLDNRSAYPRFRGADGLGTVHGAHLARNWFKTQPRLLWKHKVGAGWSGFAVAGRQAITQEQRGDEECVVCYHRHTGRELWVHRDRAHYRFPDTGDGPRATPTITGEHVYSLGATGILNCLDRATGTRKWSLDILADHDVLPPPHGMTGSPLVFESTVIVCTGGDKDDSLIALDQATGSRVWASGKAPAAYTSPMLATLAGQPQILVMTPTDLTAHDPRSGRELWTTHWGNEQKTNCSQPYPVSENQVFISTNYGTGCALVEITRGDADSWQAKQLWTNRTLQTKFSSAVVHQGYAYGLDDGILECVSLEDGRRRWKRGRYGHGQLILADDLLLIQAEDGRVVLVEASPDGLREQGTLAALDGKTWNYPALAGRQLFVRNDQEAACYELPLED